jgi:hypothetical protein
MVDYDSHRGEDACKEGGQSLVYLAQDCGLPIGASHVGDVFFEAFVDSKADGTQETYSNQWSGASFEQSEGSFLCDYLFEAINDAVVEAGFFGLGLKPNLDDFEGLHHEDLGHA